MILGKRLRRDNKLKNFKKNNDKQDPGFMITVHIPRRAWEDRENTAILERR